MREHMSAIRKDNRIFLGILALFAAACWICYFDYKINPQDTTVFAFSYRYGFISRGFMGSLLELAQTVTGRDLMNYETVFIWSLAATFLFFLCLFAFFYTALNRSAPGKIRRQRYLVVFIGVFAFPMFVTEENFGRLDVYLAILMLVSMILLIRGKLEWLVIFLCGLGVVIHQGFVFMNVNIVLVLLFYKWLKNDRGKKRYYFRIFALTLALVSVLFLYFEFFSHVNGTQIYDEVVRNAKQLAEDGKTYSTSVVNHEILGEGVFMDEWFFHKINYIELPQFLLFFAPYLAIGISWGKKRWALCEGATEKWICAAVLLGAWTVLPQFVLKVDYGRYMYELVFYYLAIIFSLTSLGDEKTTEATEQVLDEVRGKLPAAKLLLVYPMILMPFYDVVISELNVVFGRLFDLI